MENMDELRFNDHRIILDKNLVRSSILPKVSAELERDVVIQGDAVVEGAVYARQFLVEGGKLEVKGAMFAKMEMYVNTDARGSGKFHKVVGSADSIVSLGSTYRLIFQSDINARQVKLRNAFIAGSIFAEDVMLEDCIVIGGVFAAITLEMTNVIAGTFNAPVVRISRRIDLLLPSAFSIERIAASHGTEMHNLSLADLGSLFRGRPQSELSGMIRMDLEADEMKAVLHSEEKQQVIRSYSVIGKVLAADLLDMDKFNNHFLLTAASLGSQLLKTYDMGMGEDGGTRSLSPEQIAEFFFDILHGRIDIQELSGEFTMREIIEKFS